VEKSSINNTESTVVMPNPNEPSADGFAAFDVMVEFR